MGSTSTGARQIFEPPAYNFSFILSSWPFVGPLWFGNVLARVYPTKQWSFQAPPNVLPSSSWDDVVDFLGPKAGFSKKIQGQPNGELLHWGFHFRHRCVRGAGCDSQHAAWTLEWAPLAVAAHDRERFWDNQGDILGYVCFRWMEFWHYRFAFHGLFSRCKRFPVNMWAFAL